MNNQEILQALPKFQIDSSGLFEFLEDYKFYLPSTLHSEDKYLLYVVVPKEYRTNFATIPFYVRWLVSPIDPTIVVAASVHDWLVGEWRVLSKLLSPYPKIFLEYDEKDTRNFVYESQVTWNHSASILRAIMNEYNAPKWKQFIVYSGVRIHGLLSGKK